MTLARKSAARRPPQGPNLTALAAAKFIESRGSNAPRILDERAELAEELGHRVAAATWRDMAEAAARLLRSPRRDSPAVPQRVVRRLPRVWVP